MARSTLYERMRDDPTFPRPCSRPRARVKFKRADVQAWLAQHEQQRPENVAKTQQALERLAHSPRRSEKERRRRAASLPQYGDIAVPRHFRSGGFEDREAIRLKARLEPVDDRRRPNYGRGGRYRRKFPGLADALAAGWNGGGMERRRDAERLGAVYNTS